MNETPLISEEGGSILTEYIMEPNASLHISKYLSFSLCKPKKKLEHIILKIKELDSCSSACTLALWRRKTNEWLEITMHQEDTCAATEKMGLVRALGMVHEYSFNGTCVLTVDFLNELHRHVLFFDLKRRGYIRKQAEMDEVATFCAGSTIHTYPQPESVHLRLTQICDIVNSVVFEWHRRFEKNAMTVEALELYIKLCAWTFHRIVSLHPYLDANGRMARLAVTHLLASINPFPVPLSSSSRSLYLHAIVTPRCGSDWNMTEEPIQLANMILESWFTSWQFKTLS